MDADDEMEADAEDPARLRTLPPQPSSVERPAPASQSPSLPRPPSPVFPTVPDDLPLSLDGGSKAEESAPKAAEGGFFGGLFSWVGQQPHADAASRRPGSPRRSSPQRGGLSRQTLLERLEEAELLLKAAERRCDGPPPPHW